MQLGFVSAILPELSLREVLETAAEIGYDCVEVMCWPRGRAERRYAGVTHIDANDYDAAAVRSLVDETGVQISGLGYYPNPLVDNVDERQTYVEHIKKVIALSADLDVGVANTFIGREPAKSVDASFADFEAVWPDIIAFAEEKGVKVGIENCPMAFSDDEWPGGKNLAATPAIWRRMFERIPSAHFGLNFDPSHLVWQQIDYLRAIREFSPRFVHTHAKDVRIDVDGLYAHGIMGTPLQFHTPKLPGLGAVDWGAFFSQLSDSAYSGPICVEVEDRAYEGSLENRKRALRQSERYLRQFLG